MVTLLLNLQPGEEWVKVRNREDHLDFDMQNGSSNTPLQQYIAAADFVRTRNEARPFGSPLLSSNATSFFYMFPLK